jgi:hypothetical protein
MRTTVFAIAIGLVACSMTLVAAQAGQQLKNKAPGTPWAGCCHSCSHNGGWSCSGCSERVGGKCPSDTIKSTCTTSSDTTLCIPTPKERAKGIKAN